MVKLIHCGKTCEKKSTMTCVPNIHSFLNYIMHHDKSNGSPPSCSMLH